MYPGNIRGAVDSNSPIPQQAAPHNRTPQSLSLRPAESAAMSSRPVSAPPNSSLGQQFLNGMAQLRLNATHGKHQQHAQASDVSPSNPVSPVDAAPVPPPKQTHCICCKSLLRFPASAPSFRCTICDTIHDLKPRNSSSGIDSGAAPLSLASLNEVLAEGDLTKATRLIESVFGSWELLNSSFMSETSDVGIRGPGVDFDSVREAYQTIVSSASSELIRGLMKGTERILRRCGRPIKSKEDIRYLLIIFEYSFPEDAEFHHSIAARLFGIMSNLGNELHHYVVHWLARLPVDVFQTRIELINLFISNRLTRPTNQDPAAPYQSYANDWRVSAASRTMALMFAVNNLSRKIPIFEFYNTMADFIDLVADYDSWQQACGDFAFCQYPFLLSMGAKMRILELDARRQMDQKLKEAMYSFIFQKRVVIPYLVLRVRRDHLIQDSLDQLSTLQADLKKKLRIEFVGEPGIDAGGLTKEWFLVLVRELFSPHYGMFTTENETNTVWFNPASFEASDQYYLIGVVIGLAIYNSTILDIHLPLTCYKKLLGISVDLDDLQSFRPSLAKGLRQLLEFDGDVEETFCRDFVAEFEAFGELQKVPLIENGENTPVTKENRKEFVDKFVNFHLNKSVHNQFEPFKRGFYNVCGGNALSLFRPEEVELVVRGSAEPLQLDELRAATVYEGFYPTEPVIQDFWDIWKSTDAKTQRQILMFITGSDRVPAIGSATMKFKVTYGGEDCERYPQAHTCFNQLVLYRYRGRERLREKLLRAVYESEGFGLK